MKEGRDATMMRYLLPFVLDARSGDSGWFGDLEMISLCLWFAVFWKKDLSGRSSVGYPAQKEGVLIERVLRGVRRNK